MNRKEKAEELFESGYNCAQAVALAFSDIVDIDEKTLSRLSSSFGGGLGRMREVCGAVSGAAIILGLLYGVDNDGHEAKSIHYARVQEVARKYEEINGSIVCRELLGLSEKHSSSVSAPRTPEFFKKRPCKELVGISAEILDEYIKNNPVK